MPNKLQQFRLTLFGGFHLEDDKGNVVTLGARKSKALLAWLAVNPDHQHPREKLAGLFWPDSEEIQARHSLRQALGDLRKVMPDGIGPLKTTKDWIYLDSKLITIDALVFNDALLKGDRHSLDYATELYKGEFLEGCNPRTDLFDEWLTGYRCDYSQRAAAAINQRMLQLIDSKEFDRVVPLAMQLIGIDSLQEAAYRALMRAHYELGNYAIALRWYRRCQRILNTELDVTPDEDTEALHNELLSVRDDKKPESDHKQASLKHLKAVKKLSNLKAKAAFNSSQRMLYQAEAAIEGILDRMGGQSFLIRGEVGSGKTQLAKEIVELAESQGFYICSGRVLAASDKTDDKTLLEFTYTMSSCLESTHSADDKKKSKQASTIKKSKPKKINNIDSLIKTASEIMPILLLVKDLHYADQETLALLARIITAVGNSAALLVMTSCFEGEPLDPVWRGAMRGAPLTTIDLESTYCKLED